MTVRSPSYLKSRFENNDIPQATDYEDVFDSYLPLGTSAAVVSESEVTFPIVNTSALNATEVSAKRLTLGGNFSVNATGTTQATSKILTDAINWVKFGDGSNFAVRMVSAQPGYIQYIANASVTALRMFPCVGGTFLGTAQNTSMSLAIGKGVQVIHGEANTYLMIIGG